MKLLVIGASGLLGTSICQLALKSNYEVFSVHNRHVSRFGTPIRLDITDDIAVKAVFMEVRPDVVVHAAAMTDVDRCEKEKKLAWNINVEATSNIAHLCHVHNCFLAYVSTDYVFNGEKGNYTETDQTAPVNQYGLTKLEGEERVKRSGVRNCIARTSAIYGSIPAAEKTNFVIWLVDRLKYNEQAPILTDQWNSPTLNTNLAEMILEVVERRVVGTIHLGGATRLSRYEFAQHVAKTFDLATNLLRPVTSNEISWLAKRPRDSSLNVDKAHLTLTHKPLEISEAMRRLKTEMG